MSFKIEPISLDEVVEKVAMHYGLTLEELRGRKRDKITTDARKVAMYGMRYLLNLPLVKIGEYFSRDHTTVLWSIAKVEEQMESDEAYRTNVNDILSSFPYSPAYYPWIPPPDFEERLYDIASDESLPLRDRETAIHGITDIDLLIKLLDIPGMAYKVSNKVLGGAWQKLYGPVLEKLMQCAPPEKKQPVIAHIAYTDIEWADWVKYCSAETIAELTKERQCDGDSALLEAECAERVPVVLMRIYKERSELRPEIEKCNGKVVVRHTDSRWIDIGDGAGFFSNEIKEKRLYIEKIDPDTIHAELR